MKTKNRRTKLTTKNKTRKIYGGDIDKHNIFRKILSIGYELETMSLAKFTLITTDNENEPILLNTDTNSKDYEKMMALQNGNNSNNEDDYDDYDYYANRLEETLEIDAYTTESLYQRRFETAPLRGAIVQTVTGNLVEVSSAERIEIFNGVNKLTKISNNLTKQTKQAKQSKPKQTVLVKDDNTTFLVANDMAVTPFTKYLNVFCNINDAANTANTANTHNTKTDSYLIDKNDLYTFETENGNKYKLNFETWSKKDCGMFSDVEWIITYYKPKQNKNVILNTFINVAKNLIFHLNQLEKQTGRLIMNFSEDDKEIMKKTEIRNLYHLPNTNLYYLQTHLIDKQLDIDDICFVPQMTFSCHIKDMVDIFKELSKDSINNFENYKRIADERIAVIDNIEKCINKLFENYNKSSPIVTLTNTNVHSKSHEHKTKTTITPLKNSNGTPFDSSTKLPVTTSNDAPVERPILNLRGYKLKLVESRNKILIKSIKNYLFLFLFKLQRYFNFYLTDEKVKNKSKTAKYLKDTLFFNSRHTNYEIYKAIKQLIAEYFKQYNPDIKLSGGEIASIIQKLVIQQHVLEEFLLNDANNIRKNAFLITNKLEKTHKNYGNPHYSLVSYFDFFENPIDNTTRRNENNELFHDWLQYDGVDNYSSTTDIKNNIVLTEIRSFARMLGSYIYSVADDELKKNMTYGICNQLKKHFQPDSNGVSLLVLKQFLHLYEEKAKK